MAETFYTVVQHSAFARTEDPTFKQGLETRIVDTKKQQATVRVAGGMLFASYMEAEDYAEAQMYLPQARYYGLAPEASGTFARAKIDGLRIYIPAS